MHLNYIVHLFDENLAISIGLIHNLRYETLLLVKRAAETYSTKPHLNVDIDNYILVNEETIELPTNYENISVQIDLIEEIVPA